METREKTEKKIYKLILNPMMWRCEEWNIVAISYEPQKLLDWKNSLLTKPYTDNDWENMVWHKLNKIFKKWSELEYYNDYWPWIQWWFDWVVYSEWINNDTDISNFRLI